MTDSDLRGKKIAVIENEDIDLYNEGATYASACIERCEVYILTIQNSFIAGWKMGWKV